MTAISYPETLKKHHFTETGRRCFKLREKGGMIKCKSRGECRGTLMDQVGESKSGSFFLFNFLCLFNLKKKTVKKILKFNKSVGLKNCIP